MYEIATLKTKKLPELQEIAKKIGVKRITGLKKLDLIYQIVDFIASKPDEDVQAPKKEKKAKSEVKKTAAKVLPVQKVKPKPQNEPTKQPQKNQTHRRRNPMKSSLF